MKLRNEILLAISFVFGIYVSSMPSDVLDYTEQAESRQTQSAPMIGQITANSNLLAGR